MPLCSLTMLNLVFYKVCLYHRHIPLNYYEVICRRICNFISKKSFLLPATYLMGHYFSTCIKIHGLKTLCMLLDWNKTYKKELLLSQSPEWMMVCSFNCETLLYSRWNGEAGHHCLFEWIVSSLLSFEHLV